jgi:hypothetical protein
MAGEIVRMEALRGGEEGEVEKFKKQVLGRKRNPTLKN